MPINRIAFTIEERLRVYKALKAQKLSVDEIKRKIESLKRPFEIYNTEVTEWRILCEDLKYREKNVKHEAYRNKIILNKKTETQLQEVRAEKVGLLESFFGSKATREKEERINNIIQLASKEREKIDQKEREELKKIYERYNKEYTLNGKRVDGEEYWTYMRNMATSIKIELVALRKLLKEQSHQEKLLALKAKAATTEDEIRSLAPVVRKRLKEQFSLSNLCPYCGNVLMPDASHADHIYPVSKGGKSSVRNMVFVCSPCNQAKAHKTLTQFILEQGRNRDEVEGRLTKLNKDF